MRREPGNQPIEGWGRAAMRPGPVQPGQTKVIVPMAREQAKQVLNDNDIQILNQVLARLGNRLVMIAYYDEASQTLLPVHLTNNTNPLFYYGE